MYRRAGLKVEDINVTVKSGRPGSAVWTWLSTYFLGVMERYAKLPPFTTADGRRLRRHWLAASRDKTSLLIAPALLDVVGRKTGKLVVAVALLLAGSPISGQMALPPGVVRVSFGVADRVRDSAGTETCRIPKPLATPPVFERGVTEITLRGAARAEGREGRGRATDCAIWSRHADRDRLQCVYIGTRRVQSNAARQHRGARR